MTDITRQRLLTGEHVRLRAPEPDDIDMMTGWENDTTLWHVGDAMAPYSRHNITEYVMNYDPDVFKARQLRLIVERLEGCGTVGGIDLYDFDPLHRRSAVGILIEADSRRQGYALEALRLMADYCRERLGLNQLWALCVADAEASVALFERAGYERAGLLRDWVRASEGYSDAYLMQLML